MSKENNENSIFNEDDINLFEDIAGLVPAQEVSSDIIEEVTDDITNRTEEVVDTTYDNNNEEEASVEETVEETEETEENETSEDTSSQDTQESPFTPYAKFLAEEGILPNFDVDSFDGTAEGLKAATQGEITNGIDSYKNSLPPEVKHLVDNYEAGVPFDKILQISSDRIKYSSIGADDLANEDMQKDIVKDYLQKTTRLSEERIDKQISRLSDLGELGEEAKSSLTDLIELQDADAEVERQNAVAAQENAVAAQKQQVDNLDKYLSDTDEIIPQIKMSQAIKDKIKKNLTTPVGYDENNNPINKVGKYSRENPIQFEVILNYIYEATNEFKDWSSLSKAGKRSAIKEMEVAARSIDSNRSSNTTNTRVRKGGSDGLMGAIDNMQF